MIRPKFSISKEVHEYNPPDDKIANILCKLIQIRECEVMAKVSGQPLHIFNEDQWHFDDCEAQLGTVVNIGRISMNRIPELGHRHLSAKYLSDTPYPNVQCFDQEGTEIVMGMLPVLNFELELIP